MVATPIDDQWSRMILTSSTVTFTGLASNAEMLADWVKRRTREAFIGDKDWIVVGDFNIPDVESPLYKAITARGLEVPKALLGTHGTNLAADKRYDQILHLPQITKAKMNLGGVLDYYIGDFEELFPGRAIDKQGFTYELSDHLPLWVQLGTGDGGERLDQVRARGSRRPRRARQPLRVRSAPR